MEQEALSNDELVVLNLFRVLSPEYRAIVMQFITTAARATPHNVIQFPAPTKTKRKA